MSVVLAGVKLGTYGFYSVQLPLLPDASVDYVAHGGVGIAAIIYGAVDCTRADPPSGGCSRFPRISHLGFVMLGLFALTYQGIQGSLLQMINLGFSTAGLFFLAGFLYNRTALADLTPTEGWPGIASAVHVVLTWVTRPSVAPLRTGLSASSSSIRGFSRTIGSWRLSACGFYPGRARIFSGTTSAPSSDPMTASVTTPLHDLRPREWGSR